MSSLKVVLTVILMLAKLIYAKNECGKSESAFERYKFKLSNNGNDSVLTDNEVSTPFEATGHDWPWMAHYFKCSSSIIGPKWILTAAHCKDLPVAAIIYGNDDRTYGKAAEIKGKFPHPKHQSKIPGYDIMLVE
uniref:Peptidase S1 domain-containing protein n=1 Tax=Panagrolaimus superbus TaxID=310955 RepID=A0A914YWK4_9BILA